MTNPGRLPAPILEDWNWQFAGACRDADPALFFPTDSERGPRRAAREAAAKAICWCWARSVSDIPPHTPWSSPAANACAAQFRRTGQRCALADGPTSGPSPVTAGSTCSASTLSG